ncbi:MAG: CRISPR-associated endonuclease Cas2 [Myxococcales bacterium]|nr:CRISPR-associated endonuclease Cas2 [Myxococcales bacterium]
MRHTYIVTYDISAPDRLRRVYQLMCGYGEWLQLSVFRCELSARELVELRGRLSDEVDHVEDQVLFIDIGPVDGRGAGAITYLGRPYAARRRKPLVF